MIPYACKVCGRFDEEGIIGHATSRCKPLGMVAKTPGKYREDKKAARP